MSDVQRIRELLRERVVELAQHLFPNGRREGNHWCVGSIGGEPGKSFRICLAGEKAGLWGDCAELGKHSRNLVDLWMRARNVGFQTALCEAAAWLGIPPLDAAPAKRGDEPAFVTAQSTDEFLSRQDCQRAIEMAAALR